MSNPPVQTGIEGGIHIQFRPHGAVGIRSYRPIHAGRVLIGKTPQQALQIVPLLFSVCEIAQTLTSFRALNAAQQVPQNNTPYTLLVRVETAREILLRLFLDMPRLLPMPDLDQTLFATIGTLVQRFKSAVFGRNPTFALDGAADFVQHDDLLQNAITQLEALLQNQVFGHDCAAFNQIHSFATLQEWLHDSSKPTAAKAITRHIISNQWASQGAAENACGPLPELSLEDLTERLGSADAEQFVAKPRWRGQCFETGSLGRQWQQPLVKSLRDSFGTGLLCRWVARLVELSQIPAQLHRCIANGFTADERISQSEKSGIAAVEAARGRLIHLAQLQQGRISDYRILAPTEWNFHPQGPVARSLSAIQPRSLEAREQLAHLLIHTIDPCVSYQLEVA